MVLAQCARADPIWQKLQKLCVLAMAEAKDKVVFVTKEEESDAGERYASDDSEGASSKPTPLK